MPQSSRCSSNYVVVECQKAPNGKENRHVCVPRSWIKCVTGERQVAIVYPCEDEADTAKRVRNKEECEDDWPYYIGDIRCEPNTYKDATSFIKALEVYDEFLRDTNSKPKLTENEPKTKESLKVRIKLPKPSLEKKKKKSKSKSHISKSPTYEIITEPMVKDDQEPLSESNIIIEKPAENISPQPAAPQVIVESCNPTNKVNKSTSEIPETPIESKIEEILQSYMPENNLKHILVNSLSPKSQQKAAENLEMEIDNESLATDLAFPNLTPKEREFIINLPTEHKNTMSNLKVIVLYVRNLHIHMQENKKILYQIISKLGPKTTTNATEQQQQQETPNSNTEEIPQDIEMANETNISVTNENVSELVEAPVSMSSTVDLATNKGNNSKKEKINWILKHPDPGHGLIELGKHTGVYVSAEGLKNCKEQCNDVESFAKSLLPEVFTRENNEEVEGRIMRPPMYFPAKIALVNYAMDYGQLVGWKDMEFESILNSLRDILHDDLDYPMVNGSNDLDQSSFTPF